MPRAFSQRDLAWVRDNFRPSDVLQLFGRPAGDVGRGPCPLCGDGRSRSREFWWSPRGFTCHRCKAHGDAIGLTMALGGLSFRDAVVRLLGGREEIQQDPERDRRRAAWKAHEARIRTLDQKLEKHWSFFDAIFEFDTALITNHVEKDEQVFAFYRRDLDYWRALDWAITTHQALSLQERHRFARESAHP